MHYAFLVSYAVWQLLAFHFSLYYHQSGFRTDIQETGIPADCRLASCQFNYIWIDAYEAEMLNLVTSESIFLASRTHTIYLVV